MQITYSGATGARLRSEARSCHTSGMVRLNQYLFCVYSKY